MDIKFYKYRKMMEDEIFNSIIKKDIREFAMKILNDVPDYFFSVPASSSGKYHPKNDLGEGGLVRHSISVNRMLGHLLIPDEYFSDIENDVVKKVDLLRVAALFHDCMKSGTQEEYEYNNHTKFLHPVYGASFIINEAVKYNFPFDDAKYIADAIISHMGQWNFKPNVGTLPKPKTDPQKILHLADYLASRKDINMDLQNETEEMNQKIIPLGEA